MLPNHREHIGLAQDEILLAVDCDFGAADGIDGIVGRIKKSWPRTQVPMVIATGGFAETMATLCSSFDRVEPYLTLQGLQMAHALMRRPAELA